MSHAQNDFAVAQPTHLGVLLVTWATTNSNHLF